MNIIIYIYIILYSQIRNLNFIFIKKNKKNKNLKFPPERNAFGIAESLLYVMIYLDQSDSGSVRFLKAGPLSLFELV